MEIQHTIVTRNHKIWLILPCPYEINLISEASLSKTEFSDVLIFSFRQPRNTPLLGISPCPSEALLAAPQCDQVLLPTALSVFLKDSLSLLSLGLYKYPQASSAILRALTASSIANTANLTSPKGILPLKCLWLYFVYVCSFGFSWLMDGDAIKLPKVGNRLTLTPISPGLPQSLSESTQVVSEFPPLVPCSPSSHNSNLGSTLLSPELLQLPPKPPSFHIPHPKIPDLFFRQQEEKSC